MFFPGSIVPPKPFIFYWLGKVSCIWYTLDGKLLIITNNDWLLLLAYIHCMCPPSPPPRENLSKLADFSKLSYRRALQWHFSSDPTTPYTFTFLKFLLKNYRLQALSEAIKRTANSPYRLKHGCWKIFCPLILSSFGSSAKKTFAATTAKSPRNSQTNVGLCFFIDKTRFIRLEQTYYGENLMKKSPAIVRQPLLRQRWITMPHWSRFCGERMINLKLA